SNMEYKYLYLIPIGGMLTILWSLDYWKVFSKSSLIFKKTVKGKGNLLIVLRSLVFFLGLTGMLYITYSLSFPRKPLSFSPNSKEVNDIFLVIDVSRSMLAEDLEPNRLEVAKEK